MEQHGVSEAREASYSAIVLPLLEILGPDGMLVPVIA